MHGLSRFSLLTYVACPMSDQGFSDVQKRYLEGFTSGLQIARMRGLPAPAASAQPLSTGPSGETAPAGPEAIHFEAQNRFTSEGKKLVAEEKAKREHHPLDRWDELLN
jgi:ferredoxin-nitrite reductase